MSQLDLNYMITRSMSLSQSEALALIHFLVRSFTPDQLLDIAVARETQTLEARHARIARANNTNAAA
jgi:hypothetical protein